MLNTTTRDFSHTWEPAVGTGYVNSQMGGGQWVRGSNPVNDLGYGYAFAMPRPRFMREPRTDRGTYNFARG